MKSTTFFKIFKCKTKSPIFCSLIWLSFVQAFWMQVKTLFKHFGCKARLWRKTFVQTFWVQPRLLFNILAAKQDFCSQILAAKKDFCPNILNAKQQFCSNILSAKHDFVQTCWMQSKTFVQTLFVQPTILFKYFVCKARLFWGALFKHFGCKARLLLNHILFLHLTFICSGILDTRQDFVQTFWVQSKTLKKDFC